MTKLFRLFFGLEIGDSALLPNVDELIPDYTVSHPEGSALHSLRCEILESNRIVCQAYILISR
jgi:hypothetical protein